MTKLLSQYFRCTALGIQLYSCSLVAWPKLSCVYCTGKASGWFFRHEMSDSFQLEVSSRDIPRARGPCRLETACRSVYCVRVTPYASCRRG